MTVSTLHGAGSIPGCPRLHFTNLPLRNTLFSWALLEEDSHNKTTIEPFTSLGEKYLLSSSALSTVDLFTFDYKASLYFLKTTSLSGVVCRTFLWASGLSFYFFFIILTWCTVDFFLKKKLMKPNLSAFKFLFCAKHHRQESFSKSQITKVFHLGFSSKSFIILALWGFWSISS